MVTAKFLYGSLKGLCQCVVIACSCNGGNLMMLFLLSVSKIRGLHAGYGDVVPVSLTGRLLAGISMLMGVMMIALPITVFSYNFSCVYQERARAKVSKRG
jgi:hypothetical protein